MKTEDRDDLVLTINRQIGIHPGSLAWLTVQRMLVELKFAEEAMDAMAAMDFPALIKKCEAWRKHAGK